MIVNKTRSLQSKLDRVSSISILLLHISERRIEAYISERSIDERVCSLKSTLFLKRCVNDNYKLVKIKHLLATKWQPIELIFISYCKTTGQMRHQKLLPKAGFSVGCVYKIQVALQTVRVGVHNRFASVKSISWSTEWWTVHQYSYS